MTSVRIEALCAGAIRPLPCGKPSGIAKDRLRGEVMIGVEGIGTDERADRRHHGYPAMALHHYPAEHYAWLRETLGPLPRLGEAGSMGENIATHGLTESALCIGDRFRLGTALVEVTQPRQPCATIERHLGHAGIVKAIVRSGRSGWFYRVLEPGSCSAGDTLVQVEAGHEDWTVGRTFAAVYGPFPDRQAMYEIRQLARVSDRLAHDIEKRIG